MTREQEKKLKNMLESQIDFETDPPRITSGCANDHRLTRAFLAGTDLNVEAELDALIDRGGRCCDCEVLLNCALGEHEPEPVGVVAHAPTTECVD